MAMEITQELGRLVREAGAKTAPSVVAIGRNGRGSGFVVAPGRVLTNAHNLRDETTAVRFDDGRTVQGTIVGSDVDGDLVVLSVDTAAATPLSWSDETVASGDVVVTVTAGRHRRRTRAASLPDRKSTRLNSSHPSISYAVFCL